MQSATLPEDILSYLTATPNLELHDQQLSKLQDSRLQMEKLQPEKLSLGLQRLARRRLFASNTLSTKSKAIGFWDEANALIGHQIAQNNTPYADLDALCQINAALHGEETPSCIRDQEIYSCDEQYLPQKYLVKAKAIHKARTSELVNQCFLLSFFNYLYVVTVHPFTNGNGRTGRLAADFTLIANSILPLYFVSPIQSHVALTIGGRPRDIDSSFRKFLQAIQNSYDIVMQNPK